MIELRETYLRRTVVDLNLPTPGQAPNWAPQLNNEIEKLNAEVEKVPELYDAGFDLVIPMGQSLAGGTGATPNPSQDFDFNWLRYWGVTPGEPDYHQMNSFSTLPLAGGLVERRPYGVFGALSAARMMREKSSRPVVIVPAFAGGAGFYSHNTVAGRWLVGETTYAPLAQLALTEINLAIAAATKLFGPPRKAVVIWNQGEADRDIAVSESQYASALDDLINYIRAGVNLRDSEMLPWVIARQLPERRSVDGQPGRGVDAAQVNTPTRVPYTAVISPRVGFANADNTHANAEGQRAMGVQYYEAIERAETNRPSLAPTPVRNLKLVGDQLIWDPPARGRLSTLRIRGRAKTSGVWSAVAAVPGGTTQYPVSGHLPSGTDAVFSVQTSGASGDSTMALTTGVMPGYATSNLQFIFNADTLDNINNTTVAPGTWRSSGGLTQDLGMGIYSGSQPAIEYNVSRLPNHLSVMFSGGSTLGTDRGRLSISDFTFAMLIQTHNGDLTELTQLLAGDNQSFRVFYRQSDRRTALVVNEGTSIPVDMPTGWVVVVVRKSGTTAWIDIESVSGTRVSNTGAVPSGGSTSQVVLSAIYGGNYARVNYQEVRGYDTSISSSGVTGLIDQMFKNAGLR